MMVTLRRRQLIGRLIEAGAVVPLAVPLAQASSTLVNAAWTRLLREPWYFAVNDCGTIANSSDGQAQTRRDVFESVDVRWGNDPEQLIDVVNTCAPLKSRFQDLALNWADSGRFVLNPDDGWEAWVRLEGQRGAGYFINAVEAWLDEPVNWAESDWFSADFGTQIRTKHFFENENENENEEEQTLSALGAVLVAAEHLGRRYAELRQGPEHANRAAEVLRLAYRFKVI